MRVKIGDQWFSSEDQPICVQISKKEQEDIKNIDIPLGEEGRIASFPSNHEKTIEEIQDWMSN